MTNQEVYDYVSENILDHLKEKDYIADIYVKKGYGQIKGGYFEVAYLKNEEIKKSEANPSQKWHLLHSYYDIKIERNAFDMTTEANLHRIMCPQLMMWIAEIAGLNRKTLMHAMECAIVYEKTNNTKDSRRIKKDVLKNELQWVKICNVIKNAHSWQEVINEVSKII